MLNGAKHEQSDPAVRHEPFSSGACRSIRRSRLRGASRRARLAGSPSCRRTSNAREPRAHRRASCERPLSGAHSRHAATARRSIRPSSATRSPKHCTPNDDWQLLRERVAHDVQSDRLEHRRHRLRPLRPTIPPTCSKADAPPRGFAAKLAVLLHDRYRAGGAPITLLPCELVSHNGDTLRDLVTTWREPGTPTTISSTISRAAASGSIRWSTASCRSRSIRSARSPSLTRCGPSSARPA